MTTTGFIYDPVTGIAVARILDDSDVIDATIRDGGKIATVRDGNLYDLQGQLLGHLATPDGNQAAAPGPFMALLQRGSGE